MQLRPQGIEVCKAQDPSITSAPCDASFIFSIHKARKNTKRTFLSYYTLAIRTTKVNASSDSKLNSLTLPTS